MHLTRSAKNGFVERSVLENQTTEVAVGCDDVVGFFFLTEFVTVVQRFSFGCFANQRRCYQGTVHGGEQSTAEDTSNSPHMEGVHQDVVFSLEHDHEVECAGNTQGHTVRKTALSDRVNQEYCGCCCHRCRVSDADPRTRT